jgi:3-deoxy-D-arabino-heptulosonate 7-phosphate (DAHP) synthase
VFRRPVPCRRHSVAGRTFVHGCRCRGADGLIIEVHNNPAKALCDGAQSLTPDMFDSVVKSIKRIATAVDRKVSVL